MNVRKKVFESIKQLFRFQNSGRSWQIPVLSGICLGVPLLIGYFFHNLSYGLIASLSGMLILYIPSTGSITRRLITIFVCAFGFMTSFAVGQFFSFNPIVAVFALGAFAFLVHWIILTYKTSPPRSFFFIMIAALSISQPFNLELAPLKIGFIALGTIFSVSLASIFILTSSQKIYSSQTLNITRKNLFADSWESIIMGSFMAIGLALGYLMKFESPYWVAVSSAAVMQGASLNHIWQRSFHRLFGTFVGLVLCWVILSFIDNLLIICFIIILFQVIIEILVVRHYALAVVFITPMAILISETGQTFLEDSTILITARFWEICVGSTLGLLGGWLLYKEKLRYKMHRRIIRFKNLRI